MSPNSRLRASAMRSRSFPRYRLAIEQLEDRTVPVQLNISGSIGHTVSMGYDENLYSYNIVGIHSVIGGDAGDRTPGEFSWSGTLEITPTIEAGDPDSLQDNDEVTVQLYAGMGFGLNRATEHAQAQGVLSYGTGELGTQEIVNLPSLDAENPGSQYFSFTGRIGQAFQITVSGSGSIEVGGDLGYNSLSAMVYVWGNAMIPPPPPDLVVDPVSSMWLDSSGSQVNFLYSILNSSPSSGVPMSLFWSTGPSQANIIPGLPAAYSTTYTGWDADVGYHQELLTLSELGTGPAAATHLVMVLDPDNVVAETDETNNVASVALPVKPKVTQVTAQDDANGPDDGFGTYLSGVPLGKQNFFTVSTQGSAVKKVKFQVAGQAAVTKAVDANGVAKFNFEPGTLKAGEYIVTAQALDVANKKLGDLYTRTIHVIAQVGFKVQADVPGVGMVDATRLRLVAGIKNAPTLSFTATVTNLPLPDVYKDKLAVRFYDAAKNTETSQSPLTLIGATATFTLPTAKFQNVLNGAAFDYNTFLTPRDVGLTPQPKRLNVNAASNSLFVIAKPSWLKSATYTAGDDLQRSLGNGQVGYALALAVPVVDFKLPAPSVAGGIFDGLTSP